MRIPPKKENALEVKHQLKTFNEVVERLEAHADFCDNVYYLFNGHKLYALFDTRETCEEKVYGKSLER